MSAPPTAATAHAAFRARKYFGEIDGLRAFAIAAVAWNHSGHGPDNFGHGLGVVLFFVLSGFLITTLLLREESKTGTISLTGFYARRSLRIFPLYFSVLALYVVLVLVVEKGSPEGRQFFSNLPYYLTFTANYFVTWEEGKRTIFYFAWSLSAQEQFYTIWPVVVRYLRPWWAPVAVMVGTLVATEAVGRHGERVSLVLKADIRPGRTGEMQGKLDRLEAALAHQAPTPQVPAADPGPGG